MTEEIQANPEGTLTTAEIRHQTIGNLLVRIGDLTMGIRNAQRQIDDAEKQLLVFHAEIEKTSKPLEAVPASDQSA